MKISLIPEPPLEPGEYLIEESHARASLPIPPRKNVFSYRDGKLFRTNHRLIWLRSRLAVPGGAKSFDVSYSQIRRCKKAHLELAVLTEDGVRWFQLQTWNFLRTIVGGNVDDWVACINREIGPTNKSRSGGE